MLGPPRGVPPSRGRRREFAVGVAESCRVTDAFLGVRGRLPCSPRSASGSGTLVRVPERKDSGTRQPSPIPTRTLRNEPENTLEYRDARRDQILTAARRCFLRDGFHATSMQDLFAEAGLCSSPWCPATSSSWPRSVRRRWKGFRRPSRRCGHSLREGGSAASWPAMRAARWQVLPGQPHDLDARSRRIWPAPDSRLGTRRRARRCSARPLRDC